MKDYYSILGVAENATPDDIKQAYRRLAQQHHPDRNPGNAESESRFKSISEANQVLSDPSARQQYDQARQVGFGMSGGDIFSDILQGFGFNPFRNHNKQRAHKKSQTPGNAVINIEVSLNELEAGQAHRSFDLTKNITCTPCNGAGGDSMKTCETCMGQGNLIQEVRHGGMHFQARTTCPQCEGKGQRIIKPCSNCRGSGIVTQKNSYKVTLISEKL